MALRPLVLPKFGLLPAVENAALELPRGHLPALDAIRGLAILVVTLYRFGGGGGGPAEAMDPSWLVSIGQRGVDLFFVLSGFLITGILFDAKGREHYFRNFYVRRALRIFPLYYAVLAAVVFFGEFLPASLNQTLQPAVNHQAWLWFYGANVYQSITGSWGLEPLNHFWSLAIEEHFYLVWPAVIYFLSRRAAMQACGLLFFGSIAARMAWLACGGNDVAAEVLTPLRMDGLVLGSWIALAARGEGGLAWLREIARPTLLCCGAFALASEVLGRRLFGLPYAAWAGSAGALLVLVVASDKKSLLGRASLSRVFQFFGKYSYGIYVFQLPLIYLAAPMITAGGLATALRSPLLGQLAYCLVLTGLTTLAALASWHLFEKRLLGFKRRFGG